MRDLQLLWGKSHPEKSLLAHCIDVGCCAQVLLREGCGQGAASYMAELLSMDAERIPPLIGYLASLHDVGKANPVFQGQVPELDCVQTMIKKGCIVAGASRGKFRHERYTKTILQRIWSTGEQVTEDWGEVLSVALSLHHQGKSGSDIPIPSNHKKPWWETQQDKLEHEMRTLFVPPLEQLGDCHHIDAFATLLTGLVILADWVASGDSFNHLVWTTPEIYYQAAYDQAQATIEAYGLSTGTTLPSATAFSDLWKDFTSEELRPVQNVCQAEVERPGALYMIEAPMGEGKTECGLYLANLMCHTYGKEGIYFALPTMATSNQMHTRMDELLIQNGVGTSRLLHAMAWLMDRDLPNIQSDSQQEASAWLAPLRRGLLAQYAVGTVDQAMMAVLRAKYTVLRLLGLSNKVLIIDEIHAYDTYMSEVLDRLLAWCRGLHVPVILLSATLPSGRKASLLEAYGTPAQAEEHYPLVTTAHWSGEVTQRTCDTYMSQTFHFQFMPETDLISAVLDSWNQKGGCLCVLANTVGRAQEIFTTLVAQGVPREELLLFHARFPAEARQRLEKSCISMFGKGGQRPRRFIVIGTQVLEQSLDVDFDTMFTEIAPIDLLLQRAGRVFRHRETVRPSGYTQANICVSYANDKDFGVSSVIYEPLLLHRTYAVLTGNGQVSVPGDMRRVIEQVYHEGLSPDELAQGMKMQFKQELDKSQAEGMILTEPNPRYFFATEVGSPFGLFTREDEDSTLVGAAKTRLGAESASVALLPESLFCRATVEKPSREVSQQVLLQSVTLRKGPIESLLEQGVEGRGLLKRCQLFCLEVGETLSSPRCTLRNDIDLGIVIERT